jgi:hypothetical protein
MSFPKLRIEPEKIGRRAEISLENTTGFTIENHGNSTIWVGFKDAATGRAIDITPGSDRLFNGTPGAVFTGELIIDFDESTVPAGVIPKNSALIIKQLIVGC